MALTACFATRSEPIPESGPAPWREWPEAAAQATRLAADGRLDDADSVLTAFAARWPGTPEAEEGDWWRIAQRFARAEDSASTADVIVRIDALLARSPASARRAELVAMRRFAVVTQQLRAERNAARAERDALARTSKEEADKLRAELAELRAELERVRKRVTRRQPTP